MIPNFLIQPENHWSLSGIAKNANGSPINDMDVMLLTSKTGSMLGDRTNKEGKFKFDGLVFADTSLLTLQATGSTKTKNTTVFTIDQNSAGPVVEDKKLPGIQNDVNQSMVAYLNEGQVLHNNSNSNIGIRTNGRTPC